MPIPSPPRPVMGVLAAAVMSVALYFFVQGAVMLYELYRFAQWMKEISE